MLNIIIISIVKIINNILSTGKTILIQRNKGILAGLSVIISQVIFYKLIDAVNDSESDLIMYVISIPPYLLVEEILKNYKTYQ